MFLVYVTEFDIVSLTLYVNPLFPLSGMDIVERIYDKWRQKPDQQKLISKGNDYLLDNFPGLSYVIAANPSV